MSNPLEDALYYLDNFHQVLNWLSLRYSDVLSPQEQQFIRDFAVTDQPSRALLVRLIMRKGVHFRAEKLQYAEIGSIAEAVKPLILRGWVDTRATLMFDELFGLLHKSEVLQCFSRLIEQPKGKKADWLPGLSAHFNEPQPFEQWCPSLTSPLYSLTIMGLCDRFRLMFFGNLYQDWSEFVLADLGIYTYEKVEFCAESRGLRSQADVDALMFLQLCQQAFEEGEAPASVLAQINSLDSDNPWLNRRRAKLLFQLGQQCERLAELALAEQIYRTCSDPGARQRLIRVLERREDFPQAMALASAAEAAPYNAAEAQHVQRVMPRLRRKLGLPALPKAKPQDAQRLDLVLIPPDSTQSVELCVQAHLTNDTAPVHYVENSLINSLFGLLCWPAIFAPLPGSFFHPFQRGPVDLHSDDFQQRRADLFDACLAELADGRYRVTLRQRYFEKWGVQSPFVDWDVLTEELLEQALICLPAEHLRHWFERLLLDIRANRAGMPDLIQFFPAEKTYLMIEVKGPGDRLQDNQLRWLAFCNEHQMPVSVCYVRWQTES